MTEEVLECVRQELLEFERDLLPIVNAPRRQVEQYRKRLLDVIKEIEVEIELAESILRTFDAPSGVPSDPLLDNVRAILNDLGSKKQKFASQLDDLKRFEDSLETPLLDNRLSSRCTVDNLRKLMNVAPADFDAVFNSFDCCYDVYRDEELPQTWHEEAATGTPVTTTFSGQGPPDEDGAPPPPGSRSPRLHGATQTSNTESEGRQTAAVSPNLESPNQCNRAKIGGSRELQETPSQNDTSPDISIVREVNYSDGPGFIKMHQRTGFRIYIGMRVYAFRRATKQWNTAKIVATSVEPGGQDVYRVKFEESHLKTNISFVPGRQLAFSQTSPRSSFCAGTRVVAFFSDNGGTPAPRLAAGVVGEVATGPTANHPGNMHRFLVFFDEGGTEYVSPNKVHHVFEFSDGRVWEDLADESVSYFIRDYLRHYPKRILFSSPTPGKHLEVESAAVWRICTVLEADCSLMKIQYQDSNTEWLFRGSPRIRVVNKHLTARQAASGTIPQKSIPGSTIASAIHMISSSSEDEDSSSLPSSSTDVVLSTSSKQTELEVQSELLSVRPKGPHKMASRQLVNTEQRVAPYELHRCKPKCIPALSQPPEDCINLQRPCAYGFSRNVIHAKIASNVFKKHADSQVIYRTPCGLCLRSVQELDDYLLTTNCTVLSIDCFAFDPEVDIFQSFDDECCKPLIEDFSGGKEKFPIPVVNDMDESVPTVQYVTERILSDEIKEKYQTDPGFLICCDCTDNCMNKRTCACSQLTIDTTKATPANRRNHRAGYNHRRLMKRVDTGIYECNSSCKCNANTCYNRVVQQGSSVRMQLFMTEMKGWGVRALDYIPAGSFIATYAGELLTDELANQGARVLGDTYLVDLDLLEVVDDKKQIQFQQDEPEEPDEDNENEHEDDSEDAEVTPMPPTSTRSTPRKNSVPNTVDSGAQSSPSTCNLFQRFESLSTSGIVRGSTSTDSETSDVEAATVTDDVIDLRDSSDEEMDCSLDSTETVTSPHHTPETSQDVAHRSSSGLRAANQVPDMMSTREVLFKENLSFVLDAMRYGNVGRFFNHSCRPNVFVQNVFTDSHDLRFHQLAFFTGHSVVQPGEELCWDYGYEPGSVAGKVLYCHCGTVECIKRLL